MIRPSFPEIFWSIGHASCTSTLETAGVLGQSKTSAECHGCSFTMGKTLKRPAASKPKPSKKCDTVAFKSGRTKDPFCPAAFLSRLIRSPSRGGKCLRWASSCDGSNMPGYVLQFLFKFPWLAVAGDSNRIIATHRSLRSLEENPAGRSQRQFDNHLQSQGAGDLHYGGWTWLWQIRVCGTVT